MMVDYIVHSETGKKKLFFAKMFPEISGFYMNVGTFGDGIPERSQKIIKFSNL